MLDVVKFLLVQVIWSCGGAGETEAEPGARSAEVLLRARDGTTHEGRRGARQARAQLRPSPCAPAARPRRAVADERARRAPLLRRLQCHRHRRPPRSTRARPPAGTKLRKQVMELMSQPPDAIAALSEADQRALRDILARAVTHLHAAG